MEDKSHYERVKEFMEGNEEIPENFQKPSKENLELRKKLLTEEFNELIEEIDNLQTKLENEDELNKSDFVDYVKELSDLIVISLGSFAICGINADKIMKQVLDNNDEKLDNFFLREDGKLVVPEEKKAELKEKVHRNILNQF